MGPRPGRRSGASASGNPRRLNVLSNRPAALVAALECGGLPPRISPFSRSSPWPAATPLVEGGKPAAPLLTKVADALGREGLGEFFHQSPGRRDRSAAMPNRRALVIPAQAGTQSSSCLGAPPPCPPREDWGGTVLPGNPKPRRIPLTTLNLLCTLYYNESL